MNVGTDKRGALPWPEFCSLAPGLAGDGRKLIYQGHPVASAYLATVAADGGARVHPVAPVIHDSGLWLFVVDMSPKYRDLVRSGKFALHSAPPPNGGQEFHLRGEAALITDAGIRQRVADLTEGRQGGLAFEALFECFISSALHTVWENWGQANAWPQYRKWLA